METSSYGNRLATLVDRYFAAYREATTLPKRRDRELTELRSRFASPRSPRRPEHLIVRFPDRGARDSDQAQSPAQRRDR